MYFLTLSIAILMVTACSTPQSVHQDWLYLDGKYEADNPQAGLPAIDAQRQAFDKGGARGNLALDTTGFMARSSEIAKATFKKMCSDPAVGKKMEVSVTAFLPQMPAGMKLEESNRLRSSLLQGMRNRMKEFFQNEFRDSEPAMVKFYANSKEPKALAEDLRYTCPNVPSAVFYSLNGGRNLIFTFSPPAYLEGYDNASRKSTGTYTKSYVCSADAKYLLVLDKSAEPTKERFRTCYIWSSPKDKKLTVNESGDANIDCGVSDTYRGDERKYRSVNLVKEEGDGSEIIRRNTAEILVSDRQKMELFPLTLSKITELSLLNYWYTIKPRNIDSFDRIVADQKDIWRSYVTEFTKVQETATSNANEFKFKISLDLEPFCSSGVHINDALSK